MVILAACSAEEAPIPSAETIPATKDGATLYQENCASCHEGGVPKAPHSLTFNMSPASSIMTAMNGVMSQQSEHLSDDEKVVLAEFLSGQKLGASSTVAPVLMCNAGSSDFDASKPARSVAWGITQENTRHVAADDAGLTAEDVPHLELKWAFSYADATRARSQPTIGGGAVFIGSQNGTIYALDEDTGCARWTYQAEAEVRSALTLDGVESDQPMLYFGDFNANAYAIDADTGALIWKVAVGDHVAATITGSPKLYEDTLYVPVSSREWASAADPEYECCTFRGNVVALNKIDGTMQWRGHVVPDEPVKTDRSNAVGIPIWNPAGAPVWNSPTVDTKRGRLYIGTGEAYTSPAVNTSDAIVAMDMENGALIWAYQGTEGDAWNLACVIEDKTNSCGSPLPPTPARKAPSQPVTQAFQLRQRRRMVSSLLVGLMGSCAPMTAPMVLSFGRSIPCGIMKPLMATLPVAARLNPTARSLPMARSS
jgi:polyvinyl alcohol dehydrogenase (cytochrome)